MMKQQRLLASLKSRMEQANREALNQHKLTVGKRYRTEFELQNRIACSATSSEDAAACKCRQQRSDSLAG
eukprot:257045-Amphidinium_carterae.1